MSERLRPANLCLVVPCYNEEEALPVTCAKLLALMDRLCAERLIDDVSGIVFVDDGSKDRTWDVIEQLAQDRRVHGLKLASNRGHQNALLAGLVTSAAEITISLDADLQDDIEAIPKMIAAYREGSEIVFGVRSKRDADTVFKRRTALAYYGLLRKCGVELIPDHADFRLMSRKAIGALRDFREVNLFLRGLVPMLGFRTAVVLYERSARLQGESKYPIGKMIKLALDGIFAFSTLPLQLITFFGVLVSLVSMGVGVWAVVIRLATDKALPGWASTVVPMYFLGGLQLLALGIIGGYLARIYTETKQRPRFIIDRSV